ncbi:hypothetical protein BR63_02050 [Thermanaerosceptrum fracticalcis]|uniref:Uncharacterized protein n=1 Tax=Thermanaerosceptrum fracticalcis TaxID=1712410 RepID=A0A7G6DZF3_THEFR|nr:hypothetical protein [Thermanaerosceptrum fracticalcis]QNB45207.1 hypothetical protein BR63_02050 [Thermanaerosceptrum fracticalcis]
MTLLEKLKDINELTRKGKRELSREEILELCDIVRCLTEKNRVEVYDYLIENDLVLSKRVEHETINWLSNIFQHISEAEGEGNGKPRIVH